MRKALNLVLGFIVGGLVGGALTLLLTPRSGKDLQTEIRDYVHTVQYEVEQAASARRAQMELELARLRGEVETH